MKGVATLPEIVRFVKKMRAEGKKIVTTNGCFDILHVGHLRYLEWAKRQGDILIVGINSDASVRGNKGPSRPINPARERAELVAALRAVDATFIFNESTPIEWLAKVKPDMHVKGGDRSMREIVEKSVVERHGGRTLLAPHIKGLSTSNIVKRARRGYDFSMNGAGEGNGLDGQKELEKEGTITDAFKAAKSAFPGSKWGHYGVKNDPAVTVHILIDNADSIVCGYVANRDGSFAGPRLTNEQSLSLTLGQKLTDLTDEQRTRLKEWISAE